jgi:hypothetical protein
MIGQPMSLRWRLLVRGMNPAEVEMGDLQGQRKAMISQEFAVPEGLAGEATVEQPHIEVLPFHVVDRYFRPVYGQRRGTLFGFWP